MLKYFFISLFFIFNFLYANDVGYSFHVSNEEPYEKEGILLDVNLTQLDKSKVMLFNFSLKKSTEYTFHQVGFTENEKYHDLRQEYFYLIYPKKSGKIAIAFEMTKSITNDDKVAYGISGDRDNVKGLEKEDIVVDLKPLVLEVKSLPLNIDLVGDFTLKHTLDKKITQAYDPINLSVELKGKGFLESFELLKKDENYRLFSQNPKLKLLHSKMGSMASIKWDYAISAKENFVLPKVSLKAFNPKTQKSYELGFPAYKVEVEQVESATLLDKEDYPARAKGIDWDFWANFLSYVIVFVAGFLMPRDLFKQKEKKIKNDEDILKEKIKEAKSHKALLQILLLENKAKFLDAIETLEGVVYNGKKTALATIKEKLVFEGNFTTFVLDSHVLGDD